MAEHGPRDNSFPFWWPGCQDRGPIRDIASAGLAGFAVDSRCWPDSVGAEHSSQRLEAGCDHCATAWVYGLAEGDDNLPEDVFVQHSTVTSPTDSRCRGMNM